MKSFREAIKAKPDSILPEGEYIHAVVPRGVLRTQPQCCKPCAEQQKWQFLPIWQKVSAPACWTDPESVNKPFLGFETRGLPMLEVAFLLSCTPAAGEMWVGEA